MKTAINTNVRSANEELLLAREQEREVLVQMTNAVRSILRAEKNGVRLEWGGTKADLLEMLKLVSDKGTITFDDGMPATFRWLVDHTFAFFRLTPIHNPYASAQRAAERKGVRRRSLVERLKYVFSHYEEGCMMAFWNKLIIK